MGRISISTIIKLVVASLVVGAILTFLGADPLEFWGGVWLAVKDGVASIPEIGWGVVLKGGQYVLVGAAVVIPIWLISLALKARRTPKDVPPGQGR